MENRVRGMTVDEFVVMMDEADLYKALIPVIRVMSGRRKPWSGTSPRRMFMRW